MATSAQIKKLIQSHLEGDNSRFYSTAMQLAASEAKKGNSNFAKAIKELIDDAKSKGFGQNAKSNLIPISKPSGELERLLNSSFPSISFKEMILDQNLKTKLKRIIDEQKNYEKLSLHGLNPRKRILLEGAPGTGKSMTAAAIAHELGLPLFTVRLDGLITKYMGETASKLKLIFDSVEQVKAVYLFDEFDSIGSKRSLNNDVGEIRRILNSFLLFIEQVKSTSLVIAATNYTEHLDFALFRRFDAILNYKLPTKSLIKKTYKKKLSLFEEKEINYSEVVKLSEGLSYAEITKVCEEAMKEGANPK
jgi:SpoVK/Ycf46/Vps4 family AAA+-type ATPase